MMRNEEREKGFLVFLACLFFFVLVWQLSTKGGGSKEKRVPPKGSSTRHMGNDERNPDILSMFSEEPPTQTSKSPSVNKPSSTQTTKKEEKPNLVYKIDVNKLIKEMQMKEWKDQIASLPSALIYPTYQKDIWQIFIGEDVFYIKLPNPGLYIQESKDGRRYVKYLLPDRNTLKLYPIEPQSPLLIYRLSSANIPKSPPPLQNPYTSPFSPNSNYLQPPPPPKPKPPYTYFAVGSGHWVSKNYEGKYIELEDGSLWEISDLDQIDTQLWLDMDDIVVVESSNPFYPYLLINTDDKTKAEAKLIRF